MAGSGRTPRPMRQRQANWANPGVEGRATGMTLAPRPLNEDGMETLQGLYSSPEKSPPKVNGLSHNSTAMEQDEDETMNIGSSTIPEPTEVIKARNGKSILPPPKSRSPIKTSLGSAARRSLGARSSPSRAVEHETPTHRAMSHPLNRRLNYPETESHSSVKNSTSRAKLPPMRPPKLKPTPMSGNGKRKRDLFDPPVDQDEELFGGETSLVNGSSLGDTYDDHNLLEDGLDDSLQLPNADDLGQIPGNQLPQNQDIISPSTGKDSTAAPSKTKGKRGKTAASNLAESETRYPAPHSGRRGRSSNKTKVDALMDEPVEGDAEPSKKPNGAQAAKMQPPKSKGARGRQVLALGNPNTKLQPRRRASRSASKGPLSPSKTRIITRSETPGDELSFRTTRTGRNVMKPLAFWRGEAAVFSPGRLEDGNRILPSIKEVIRTEEVAEPMRTHRQARKRRRPAKRPEEDELPEEDDDEEEYWETEAGVMRASVMLWDPTTGKGDEESTEEADVAYAAEAIEMRDISGATFRFAKTLTLPFFGSGMVDLPPGGTKRVKNSRKMQMVFFVFYGRVTVDLGTPTQRFSIGRGGMWQVPRGNFYAISNDSTKPARIFFAQGCEVAPESLGFDESGAA